MADAAGIGPAPNVSRSQACCSVVKGDGVSSSVAIAVRLGSSDIQIEENMR